MRDTPLGKILFWAISMTMVLKAEKSGAPGLLAAAQNEVRQLNRDVLVDSPRLMQDVMARSYWKMPLLGKLLAGFAVLALVLASVGIGAVVSYAVSQRTHEIGVRLALGADIGRVRWLVVADALVPVGGGIVADSTPEGEYQESLNKRGAMLAAIAAGCRFFAGYPITPSSETSETMARRLPEVGGICLQM
jgi:hypothetical protein